MSTDYALILPLAYPGAEWSLSNTVDFTTLDWGSSNAIPKPSYDDLMAAFELAKPQEALRLLRIKRNELLQQTDMYVLPDFPHPDEVAREAWLAYRQQLRDLPQVASPQLTLALQLDEASVAWPSKPT